MTTAIAPFTFPVTGQQVRTLTIDSDPWFIARDVCTVLGIGNASQALAQLDDDEKGITTTDTPGGDQRVSIINEPGLYSLVLRSRKPEAKPFKRWITHEVLPSIRKTGAYSLAKLDRRELARMVIESEDARELAERKVAELEPKAASWDVLADTATDFSVREAAHILHRDPSIDTGQGRLFASLRSLGLIDQQNRPYQSHSRHVRLRLQSYNDGLTGEAKAREQVRVTVAGIHYLHRKLGGTSPVQLDLGVTTARTDTS